jgi:hypothetical protein
MNNTGSTNTRPFTNSNMSTSSQSTRPQTVAPPAQAQSVVPPPYVHPLQAYSHPFQPLSTVPADPTTLNNTHPYIHARRTYNNISMGAGTNGGEMNHGDATEGADAQIEPSVSTTDLPGMMRRVLDG